MNSPKLRFKDDDGKEFPEWEEYPLSELAVKNKKKNINNSIPTVLTNSATDGIVPQDDYFEREIVTESNLSNYYTVELDSFVYNPRVSRSAPVGPINRNCCKCGIMSPLYTVFTFIKGELNFFEHFFKSTAWYFYIKSVSNSGARHDRMNITDEMFFSLPIPMPDIKEQQKIADFLSSVDERITQATKKVDLLEQYKKGAMQQIFSQKLRFKDDDGKEFPEWEEYPLSELAVKNKKKNINNSIPTVLTNSATDGIVPQDDYFEREIVTESNLSNYYTVELDSFVYNPRVSRSAPVGPINRNCCKCGIMSPLYTVFTFIKGELNFFEHFFKSTAWYFYIKSVSNSGARHDRMNITDEMFFNLPIPMPNIKEQQKIADFLSGIDDKIQSARKQLDALKTFKKGLLQQMFV